MILSKIESLVQIEHQEHLKVFKNQRNYRLLKNHLQINIPRTRDGSFSPATIQLVKLISKQVPY